MRPKGRRYKQPEYYDEIMDFSTMSSRIRYTELVVNRIYGTFLMAFVMPVGVARIA